MYLSFHKLQSGGALLQCTSYSDDTLCVDSFSSTTKPGSNAGVTTSAILLGTLSQVFSCQRNTVPKLQQLLSNLWFQLLERIRKSGKLSALLRLSIQKRFITELGEVAGDCFQTFYKSSSLLLLGQTSELPAEQGFLTRAQQEIKTFISHPGLEGVWGVSIPSEMSVLTKIIPVNTLPPYTRTDTPDTSYLPQVAHLLTQDHYFPHLLS